MDELARLVHEWLDAVRRRDVAFLERLLAPEFTLTTGRLGSEIRTRDEYLRITRDEYRLEEFAFEAIDVVAEGDAAVLRSRLRQRGSMGSEDRTQSFLMTDVLFRRDGRWQAVARHVSPLPPPLRPAAIDHCVIAVSDWERSNAFYRDVLGAEIDQRDEWFAHYRFGDWMLNVHGPGFEGLNARLPVEPGGSDLCFVWPGPLEEAVAHLHACAVELAGELDGGFARGPARSVYFRDPDGSLLELVSYAG
jgi:catechol 2,3-dioxygenase-like lactoylglutathione lyase family enzyme/ketosteroid isomerase-like protein